MRTPSPLPVALSLILLSSIASTAHSDAWHDGPRETRRDVAADVRTLLEQHAPTGRIADFQLPDSGDLARIPQDPRNPLTPEKVRLGKFLFHETAVGTRANDPARIETFSCASCHHVDAGFKSGIPQGIGDGGVGFARGGQSRRLARGLDANAADGDPSKPDLQPVTSPTALNTAYQDVMLWNGALGSRIEGVNAGIAALPDFGPDGFNVNQFGLSGLETQVLAGTRVHRLEFDNDSILQTNKRYRRLYARAFPDGDPDEGFPDEGTLVTPQALGAAFAIAAYERTLLANRAPFQRWLRGDRRAMKLRELRGARLFFGKAGCVDCHTGPALSSWPDATADELFFAVGFADLDTSKRRIHGTVPDDVSRGRGGFTGNPADDYKFKIPQLYNLADTRVFGHGASFRSVRDVVEYKNNGTVQNPAAASIATTAPLGLNRREIRDLTAFLTHGLYDRSLSRYVPRSLPSGNCFPVADFQSALDLKCY